MNPVSPALCALGVVIVLIVGVVLPILVLCAILRIFTIDRRMREANQNLDALKKYAASILKAIKAADDNRREEFNAMAEPQ